MFVGMGLYCNAAFGHGLPANYTPVFPEPVLVQQGARGVRLPANYSIIACIYKEIKGFSETCKPVTSFTFAVTPFTFVVIPVYTSHVKGVTAHVKGVTANVKGVTANVKGVTANVKGFTAKRKAGYSERKGS